jgi:hypothetical protein
VPTRSRFRVVYLNVGALPFQEAQERGQSSLRRASLAMGVSEAGDAGMTMECLQASGPMAEEAAEIDDIAHAEPDRGART